MGANAPLIRFGAFGSCAAPNGARVNSCERTRCTLFFSAAKISVKSITYGASVASNVTPRTQSSPMGRCGNDQHFAAAVRVKKGASQRAPDGQGASERTRSSALLCLVTAPTRSRRPASLSAPTDVDCSSAAQRPWRRRVANLERRSMVNKCRHCRSSGQALIEWHQLSWSERRPCHKSNSPCILQRGLAYFGLENIVFTIVLDCSVSTTISAIAVHFTRSNP
jgi:hypothetical protein